MYDIKHLLIGLVILSVIGIILFYLGKGLNVSIIETFGGYISWSAISALVISLILYLKFRQYEIVERELDIADKLLTK